MVRALKVPGVCSDATLPSLKPVPPPPAPTDPWLKGDTSGLLGLYDLSNKTSWPSGGAPTSGDAIYALSTGSEKGSFAGSGVTYAGGGFDFSGITAGSNILLPNKIGTELQKAANWVFCVWMKLPPRDSLNKGSTIVPMITVGDTYTSNPCLFTVVQTVGPLLDIRFPTGGGAGLNAKLQFDLKEPAVEAGQVVQLGIYKTPSGLTGSNVQPSKVTARLRTASSDRSSSSYYAPPSGSMDVPTKLGFQPWGGNQPLNSTWVTGLSFYSVAAQTLAADQDPRARLDADWDFRKNFYNK